MVNLTDIIAVLRQSLFFPLYKQIKLSVFHIAFFAGAKSETDDSCKKYKSVSFGKRFQRKRNRFGFERDFTLSLHIVKALITKEIHTVNGKEIQTNHSHFGLALC